MTTQRTWNEKSLWNTTRAFVEWRSVDRDLRAYLTLNTELMTKRFEAMWTEIGERPGDPDGPEWIDIFDHEVEIQPSDYHWMLNASVVREAVTAFEVYLEKTGTEVGHDWKVAESQSPRWGQLKAFFRKELSIVVDTTTVQEIRDLRHILTHLRGELRTKEHRSRFGKMLSFPSYPSHRAELSPETVTQILDDLGEVVRQVDPVAWARRY
ncbi:hypothetical protein [Nocardia pseudovaccinii]|uniref:hypothetical protein n=1 Tax=Nocardia pseudovaccinii TaxID=189540 RepID=UPI0007A3DBE0|nr:hypothetical protein [Nocardia pseudovaccinii]